MGKRYRPEFKQEAVNLVVKQGLSVKQVASDLGIGNSTLENWLRRHREQEQNPNILGETELAELKRLRKENRNRQKPHLYQKIFTGNPLKSPWKCQLRNFGATF